MDTIDYVIRTGLPALIYFIIFIKIIFVGASITHLLMTHAKGPRLDKDKKQKIDETAVILKETTEFIFIVATSILLVVIFSPWHNNMKYLTPKVKILFYLFGMILIMSNLFDL